MAHWLPLLMGAEEPPLLPWLSLPLLSPLLSELGEDAGAAAAVEEASSIRGAGEDAGGGGGGAEVEVAGGGGGGGVELELELETAGWLTGTTVTLCQDPVHVFGYVASIKETFRSTCPRRGSNFQGLLTCCLSIVGRVDGRAATGRVLGRGNRSILLQQVVGLVGMPTVCMLPSGGDAEQHRRSERVQRSPHYYLVLSQYYVAVQVCSECMYGARGGISTGLIFERAPAERVKRW